MRASRAGLIALERQRITPGPFARTCVHSIDGCPILDDIASIPETAADDATAELYADIRHTLRVPVTNLVWRHLATFDGALARVWHGVKPLYLDGRLDADAAALRSPPGLPRLPPWDRAVLRSAGLDEAALASVRNIFANYDATNPRNLLALMAVLARLESDDFVPRNAPAHPAAPPPAIPRIGPLPPLLDPASLRPAVLRAAMRLNDIGLPPGERALVAGVPRHLAHWPGFLALCVDSLEPVADELRCSIRFVHEDAWRRARGFAVDLAPPGDFAQREAVAAALRRFTSIEFIANYIPKVRVLMGALGG